MIARLQLAISAASGPACAFIVLHRIATGQPWWAVMWALVGTAHCRLLVDTAREMRAARNTNTSNKE